MQGKSLKDVFHSFTCGKPEMESKVYAKLYRECGIIDKKFNTNDADINFSKVKSGKVKVITFDQFKKTLELAAQKKGMTQEQLEQQIINHGGATYCYANYSYSDFSHANYHETKPDYVKLNDDKQLYSNQPSFFEIKQGYGGKTHRMFLTKTLWELKNKMKETFGLKEDLEEFYYYDENRKDKDKIFLKTEEDYQIMMMCLNHQKIIYLGFNNKNYNK